jgi:signal transduction histidine kinase
MVLVIILSVLLLLGLITLQVRVYLKLKTQTRLIEIQRYQQEKQQKLLEELIQEKQQIIGLVSHDLKGPFNRIFALIQLLSMTSTNLTDEQLDYIGKIHQISSDGLSMLRNLVDNRRLDDKGIDLFPEKLSLTNLVNTMVKNYKALAEKKKIQLFFEKENDFIIFSDKISLNRIIENIL